MAQRTFYFNGVDGTTGEYLLPPQDVDAIVEAAKNDQPDPDRQRHLDAAAPNGHRRALPWGTDEKNLAQAGWAVVFHEQESSAVRDHVGRLVAHRAKAVTAPGRLKELTYQSGETALDWLARYEVTPGNIVPTKVPLYLLIVGPPDRVPFQVTEDLDAEYAVGRLAFDTPEEYGRYVDGLIAYERATQLPNTRDAVFFGTRHSFDQATQLSADYLVTPLASGPVDADGQTVCARAGFRATPAVAADARRDVLRDVLRGQGPTGPLRASFLFTATHGVGFPMGDARQRATQGALLCQDWSGLGQITPAQYLSAADLPDDAALSGLVAVLFACYGAGTPRYDRFWRGDGDGPKQIAADPFFAALPQRLLAHPAGGALACIGHVERAWGNSIADVDAGPQLQGWQNLVSRVLAGEPLGLALKDINDRYAMRSVALATLLDREPGAAPFEDYKVAAAWLDRNDAGGYVLLGDPAVRLRPDALA